MNEPVTAEPGTPPEPRPARTRLRRFTIAGALLSAAALGTVFSVQAMASDGSTPPGYERPNPPSDSGEGPDTHELGSDVVRERGGRFAMVLIVKGADVGKAKEGATDFSACMRDNGLSEFPEFKVSDAGDGHIRLELDGKSKQLEPFSAAYKKAYKACAPIMEKAGVPLPDQPVPPGKPGKHIDKEKGPLLHKELEDGGQLGTTESA
ncbi:hypothetical protein [Streptomyces mesophilus]|uniref:hypothetical protein n=1 Tax=Streptomyces mesophilus TaxID=1775132 RepID=UPI003322286F